MNSQDDLMRALKDLAVADYAPAQARRIRDRAVAVLERRQHRPLRWTNLLTGDSRFVEAALIGALSLGCAAWTVIRSIDVLLRARGGFFWP